MQQRAHPPIAHLEVFLPATRRILVVPPHMPDGHAGQTHRREPMLFRAYTVFDVVELDERRQTQTDGAHRLRGNQTEPPAVEIGELHAV